MSIMFQAKDYHLATTAERIRLGRWVDHEDAGFTYTFENFFHPYVGRLIQELNQASLRGMLDPVFQEGLKRPFFTDFYEPNPSDSDRIGVEFFDKEIEIEGGPYSNYNWELLFHIPLTIAVHLSKNQRFAEAQRWFHYIFDPTANDSSVPVPRRFWRFIGFRNAEPFLQIDRLLVLLSTPDIDLDPTERDRKFKVLQGYQEILSKPFQPHAVARTRPIAYQYCVVMKYLDNLIVWGDNLFRQDTIESINEATQRYVLAANILGRRPERIPPRGTVRPRSFKELKERGMDEMGNALVELEGRFPFNLTIPGADLDTESAQPLLGIGRTLYFCIPPNEKMLGYWDTVADRLYKIRHCLNLEGVARPLALFDPPIDPGMLVKAAAAGISLGSVISGLNQPISTVRSTLLIQKALELAGELRGLGGALLTAIEKGDAERLALLRQRHEIKIQQLTQEVRFLQWKQAQESWRSLMHSRDSALERYRYYLRLMGQAPDGNLVPESLPFDGRQLTEENFDEAFAALVSQYERQLPVQAYPGLRLAGADAPAVVSSLFSKGNLYLNLNEFADLNVLTPVSMGLRVGATVTDVIFAVLGMLPGITVNLQWWGLGASPTVISGERLSAVGRLISSALNSTAQITDQLAASITKVSGFERRVDDWTLQSNLAAHELSQIGRQLIGAKIAEQVAHHDYKLVKRQIEHSLEVDEFLHEKFSNAELYAWMQGEIARLYYEYYRFAFDTARKAEQTMKQELMRPELEATDFIKFNYWDGGRKGLLSGEVLYLDVKRMELAYLENRKREYELTKHVSLRQLNPLALIQLKATGSCELSLPEWLFDLDVPGHYMRRIRNVSLSIPAVTGPYTSINCTLSLLNSTLRTSPALNGDDPADEYKRAGSEDDRFADYFGTVRSVVTSTGNNDSGLFDGAPSDDRYLPFEGAGGVSTWRLELPADFRQFDYNTIADTILHIRYTARQGGQQLRDKAEDSLKQLVADATAARLALFLSLRHDFPAEWNAFAGPAGAGDFVATVKRDFFPYLTSGKAILLKAIRFHGIAQDGVMSVTPAALNVPANLEAISTALNDPAQRGFQLSVTPDPDVLVRNLERPTFAILEYALET